MKKPFAVMSTFAMATMIAGSALLGSAHAASPSTPVSQSVQQAASLKVAEAFYDGNHISIKLQRSGESSEGRLVGGSYDAKKGTYVSDKNSITRIVMFINGKAIHEYGNEKMPSKPSLSWMADGKDAAIIRMTDASLLGGNLPAFTDKLQLRADIYLEGQKQPQKVNIPLQRSTAKAVVVKPDLTKTFGNVKLTASQAVHTATSSRLQLVLPNYSADLEKHRELLFDFVDDQGNTLERLTARGTDELNANEQFYYDFVIEAPSKDATGIVVKPFVPVLKKDDSGQFELDENGNLIKHYVKQLEMTIPLK